MKKKTVLIADAAYADLHVWEVYSEELWVEYEQSYAEGLDIAEYEDVFKAVAKLPRGAHKEKFASVLSEILNCCGMREGYPYQEPSDIESIKELRKSYIFEKNKISRDMLKEKIYGAWLGRICGCLLGKTVEGIRTHELHPLLKESGNFPMHRYIISSDVTQERIRKTTFPLAERCYADTVNGMPSDDDTNYMVLAQEVIKRYGRDFTPSDVARAWLDLQPRSAYCTAERVAFCNFERGITPPQSATYRNKYREYIGAQIRGDYFGYINPGNPELAAELAFRDASISHVKNGIYGEMFIAAMLACAAVTSNIKDILWGGLAEIPCTSRLYEEIKKIISDYEKGVTKEECLQRIHDSYDEYNGYHWCHTIPNAMIVAAALLYGNGDFGKSICMAVETGFDTDCNGATVGSILGMRNGKGGIDNVWTEPIGDRLETTLFGLEAVSIKERVELTLCQAEIPLEI